jgi:lipoate---protein ligase
MLYIETNSFAPPINLACEEYFLKGWDLEEDLFMLWRNEPAVVVGRFQNTVEEINSRFARDHCIPVVRRISGGGAVYHDLGNLCFSFILHDIQPKIFDKSQYIRPLFDALARLGIRVEVTARNDLMVEGKKFSGNAMALHRDRLLFHGTLLFETNLDVLDAVLSGPESGIVSKAVKSIRGSITNLKDHLSEAMDIVQFKRRLKDLLSADIPTVEYVPSREQWDAVQNLARKKYESWDWNFGNNPGSEIHRSRKLMDGILEMDLQLDKGRIQDCRVQSSSSILPGPEKLAKRLVGVRYTFKDVLNVCIGSGIDGTASLVSAEDFAQWIMV